MQIVVVYFYQDLVGCCVDYLSDSHDNGQDELIFAISPPLPQPIVAYLSFFSSTLHTPIILIDCCVICVDAYWLKQSAECKIMFFYVGDDVDGDSEADGPRR